MDVDAVISCAPVFSPRRTPAFSPTPRARGVGENAGVRRGEKTGAQLITASTSIDKVKPGTYFDVCQSMKTLALLLTFALTAASLAAEEPVSLQTASGT